MPTLRLEVAADSIASALAAQAGDADGVELFSAQQGSESDARSQ